MRRRDGSSSVMLREEGGETELTEEESKTSSRLHQVENKPRRDLFVSPKQNRKISFPFSFPLPPSFRTKSKNATHQD